MRHNYTTERSREITGSENAERLKLPHPFRDFGREKKLTNRVREENEDDEVIKLQETSQRGQAECLIISCGEAPIRNGGDEQGIGDVASSLFDSG